MSDEYINYGKSGIFTNVDANEENKQPNYRGSIEVTQDIPKGTILRIAGWENKQGTVLKSIGLSLSSKVGETADNTYKKQTSGSSYKAKVDEDIPF